MALSIIRGHTGCAEGLMQIPARMCGKLRSLRLGTVDGRSDAAQVPQMGVRVDGHLLDGPAPNLRSLDVRLDGPQRPDGIAAGSGIDRWPQMLLGHEMDPCFMPPLQRLVIGWPSMCVDSDGAVPLLRSLPPSTRELVIVIGGLLMTEASLPAALKCLALVGRTLQERTTAVGLARLELDLRDYGRDTAYWRSHARWRALEATCKARGIVLALKA